MGEAMGGAFDPAELAGLGEGEEGEDGAEEDGAEEETDVHGAASAGQLAACTVYLCHPYKDS